MDPLFMVTNLRTGLAVVRRSYWEAEAYGRWFCRADGWLIDAI